MPSTYTCGHLFIDAGESIYRCCPLFIVGGASIYRCGHLFRDTGVSIYWRPSGEGNTAALLFLIGTAISGRRNKACNSQSAIPARGHGFDGFSVFNGSEDIMATCMRHILQAVVALHICAMCFREQGQFWSKIMTKAWRKYINVMQHACGRTHRANKASKEGT